MGALKHIFRILKWTFGLLALLLILFSAGVYLMRDEIVANVTSALNQRLNSEVSVSEIKINLIENFPSASLEFSNVFCREVNTAKPDTLFYFNRVFLQLNTWKLLRRKYEVESVEVKNGRLNIAQFRNKTVNYSIWKQQSQSESGNLSIDLNQIVLSEIDFSYLDEPNSGYYRVFANGVSLRGSFENSDFRISSDGEITPRQLVVAGESYAIDQNIQHRLSISSINGDYRISDGSLRWNGGASIDLSGLFEAEGGYHLKFDAQQWTVSDLVEKLPESMTASLWDYRFSGDVSIIGVLNKLPKGDPEINIEFGIANGSAVLSSQKIELKSISTSGSLVGNIARKSSLRLQLNDFSANLPSGSVRGDFSIHNFTLPEIQINASADMDVGEVVRLLNLKEFDVSSGRAVVNVEFYNRFGDLNDISLSDLTGARLRGDLIVDQLNAQYRGYPYAFKNWGMVVDFTDRDLAIRKLHGIVGRSDFSFVGSFRNFLPYLLVQNEKLTLEAALKSDQIFLDELLAAETGGNVNVNSDEDYKLRISDKLNYNLRLDIGKLQFEDFIGEQITARITQEKGEIDVREIDLRSCGGRATGDIFITPSPNERYLITTKAQFSSIGINELFRQMHNFGQNTLIDRNLKGRADLSLELRSTWSEALEADLSSIRARGDLKIVNGELIRFEPMEELSTFIEVQELSHIRFAELENTILIADQTIQIPRMSILSSALDFSLYGTHNFENTIDYHVSLKLSDILFKNKRESDPEIDQYVVIEEGKKPYLHLRMTGSVYSPEIKYDFVEAKRTVVEEFKNEKNEVKQAFREEFGREDTTIDRTTQEPDFEIEWGTSEPDTSEYDNW